MAVIYISHPYGGKEENKKKVEEIIKQLLIDEPHNLYVSPIHAFDFLYDHVPYDDGLFMCLKLLNLCDKMYVYGEDYKQSVGVRGEIGFCDLYNKPYEIRV